MHKWLSGEAQRGSLPWRRAVLGAIVAVGFLAPVGAQALPAGCAALAEKYPDWKGKTLVNAINPHTPGYEAIDPKDPSKYVGFDIDLGEEIGECLGFKLTYKAVEEDHRYQYLDVRRGGSREYRLRRSAAGAGAGSAVQGRRQA